MNELQIVLASFGISSTATFRNELRYCLSRILAKCRTLRDGIFHYDPVSLLNTLHMGIHWKVLWETHDKTKARQQGTANDDDANFPTALRELAHSFLDPRIIPPALAAIVLRIFVRVFLWNASSSFYSKPLENQTTSRSNQNEDDNCNSSQSSSCSSRWSPSQSLLLNSIIRVMKSRQCREDLGGIIITVYEFDFHKNDPSFRIRQSILSLIKYCTEELPSYPRRDFYLEDSLFPYLLGLTHGILSDGREIAGRSGGGKSFCVACGMHRAFGSISSQNAHRRNPHIDLAILHGGFDEDDDGAGVHLQMRQNAPRQIHRFRNAAQPLNLKQVLHAKESTADSGTTCPRCQSRYPPQNETAVNEITAKTWYYLRDKYIVKLMSLFQSAKLQSKQRAFRLLQSSLWVASKHDDSPYLRICILQLADLLGRKGYEYLLESLWKQSWSENPKYLAWYTEALAHSSFCNDRQHLWDALQPLIVETLLLCKASLNEGAQQQGQHHPLLLPALGYILSKRQRLLQSQKDSIYDAFSLLVNNLACSFDDIEDWLPPSRREEDSETEQLVVATLQNLGILGAASFLDDGTAEEQGNHHDGRNKVHEIWAWSAPKPLESHRAYQQMIVPPPEHGYASATQFGQGANCAMTTNLLSKLDHDRQQTPAHEKNNKVEDTLIHETDKKSTPIEEFLGDDVLRCMFSFLGYKKLLKIRLCCKAWRDLADEDRLWHPLYAKKFGVLGNASSSEQAAGTMSSRTLWKDRFIGKWVAKSEIKFQSNQRTGFKYRICGYIGCHQVLKGEIAVKKHFLMHKKRSLKEKERLEKAARKPSCDRDKKRKKSQKDNRSKKPRIGNKLSVNQAERTAQHHDAVRVSG